MRDLAGSLIESGLATAESIVGCTPDELAEFRRVRGVAALPAQYGEFLTVMGREAGDLLRGTDFFYPVILEVGEWGQEVFDDNDMGHLFVPGSLVLGTHQGYIVFWLEPGQPSGPVHQYKEGDKSAQTWPSLLEFLVSEQAYVQQFLGK
jgi:hypothetical protein